MSTQPFRFLDLPPEIREKIYIQISTSSAPYILLEAPNALASFPLNFLLTNVQIYHELRPIYFTANKFSMNLLRHNETWSYFLSPSWRDNRRQIHSLRLNIIRWGSKDFFKNFLVPVLEDCILNGKLRDLEVRTRPSWMRTMGSAFGPHGLAGNANWEALRGLMNDPYLKRSVVMAGPPGSVIGMGWDDELTDGNMEIVDQPELFRCVEWMFDLEGGTWRKVTEEERRLLT